MKMTKEQLKKLVIKEALIVEQSFEIQKLIEERVYDSILDGLNAAVTQFAGSDEALEEVASYWLYEDDKALDKFFEEGNEFSGLFKMISGHVQSVADKILQEHKDEIMSKVQSEKEEEKEILPQEKEEVVA